MNAHSLLALLTTAGIDLQADGLHLVATPADRLTDTHRDAIRTHKSALVHLVTARSAGRRALGPEDLALASAYLDHIDETDPVTRAEYLDRLASSRRLLAQCYAAAVAAGIATLEVAA